MYVTFKSDYKIVYKTIVPGVPAFQNAMHSYDGFYDRKNVALLSIQRIYESV